MDVDLIFKIAAIGVIVAILNQILEKTGKGEYAMITTLAGVIMALMMVIPHITSLFEYTKDVFNICIWIF